MTRVTPWTISNISSMFLGIKERVHSVPEPPFLLSCALTLAILRMALATDGFHDF